MPTISEHYGITGPVPFEDIDVAADNRLYVDPHAIRLSGGPSPFVEMAVESTDTFFREVTSCVIAGTPADYVRGEGLLKHFIEPWETRLGMSESGFRGHGGASAVGSWIWRTLISDVEALVRVGVLRHIEELPLFVEGIDRDITSDITTRIIFLPLARFTESMVEQFPELTAGEHRVQQFERQVWNPTNCEWEYARVTLPVIDGKPLLLVPRGWARKTLLMSAVRYYETSVLSFAQLEQAAVSSNGKLIKTPKEALMKQAGLGRGRGTILRVTQRAITNEEDLLAQFRIFVKERLQRVSQSDKSVA